MRECISIQVGQSGAQVGNAVWELFCLEHGISNDGCRMHATNYDYPDNSFNRMFYLTDCDKSVPRVIFVDTEPTCIDEIRVGSYRNLFSPDQLLTGKEDCASNFARGKLTIGKCMIGTVLNQVRKTVEKCDSLHAFLVYHSFGGGTGSGLTALIVQHLMNDYGKRPRLGLSLYPSPMVSNIIVEPYNSIFNMLSTLENMDVNYVLDNAALYAIATVNLCIRQPTFTNINRIISQAVSGITSPFRFEACLDADFHHCSTNLIPYPRIHYLVISQAPFAANCLAHHNTHSIREITNSVFAPGSQLVECNILQHKFMACCLLYRGDVSLIDVNHAVNAIKCCSEIKWVDWCPTGFKFGINYQPPTTVPGGEMEATKRSLTGLINNSAVQEPIQRLFAKYGHLFHKRAFVHWYVGEGMEEGEFQDAADGITTLLRDYKEVTSSIEDLSSKTNGSFNKQQQQPDKPRKNSNPSTDSKRSPLFHSSKHSSQGKEVFDEDKALSAKDESLIYAAPANDANTDELVHIKENTGFTSKTLDEAIATHDDLRQMKKSSSVTGDIKSPYGSQNKDFSPKSRQSDGHAEAMYDEENVTANGYDQNKTISPEKTLSNGRSKLITAKDNDDDNEAEIARAESDYAETNGTESIHAEADPVESVNLEPDKAESDNKLGQQLESDTVETDDAESADVNTEDGESDYVKAEELGSNDEETDTVNPSGIMLSNEHKSDAIPEIKSSSKTQSESYGESEPDELNESNNFRDKNRQLSTHNSRYFLFNPWHMSKRQASRRRKPDSIKPNQHSTVLSSILKQPQPSSFDVNTTQARKRTDRIKEKLHFYIN